MKTKGFPTEENKSFFEKLLEIQSLTSSGSFFTIIGVFISQEHCFPIELSVDEETYTQLNAAFEFDDNSRYRLSLYCRWDPFLQQYCSKITRIKGERIESKLFCCSDVFRDVLFQFQSIQNIQQLASIDGLKIIKNTAQKVDHDWDNKSSISNKVKRKRTYNFMFYKYLQISIQAGVLAMFLLINSAHANEYGLYYFNSRAASSGDEIVSGIESLPVDYHWKKYQAEYFAQFTCEADCDEEAEESRSDFVYLETEKTVETCVPEGYVALTFDDGPSEFTREIVNILVEHEVGATFFFIGKNAVLYPEAVKYTASKGMSVGNHSWSHSNLIRLSPQDKMKEIVETNDVLSHLTEVPVTLFRPPFGLFDDRLLEEVTEQQMKVIMWNRDPKDWRTNSKDKIIQYFLDSEPSSGVYILHETRVTLELLPEIIEYLKQNSLQFAVLK